MHDRVVLTWRTMDRSITVVSATLHGNNLRALLDQAGMSQEEFSARLGVSFRQVNRVVLGQSVPSMLLAMKMCVVLKAEFNKVFNVTFQRKRHERPARPSKTVSASAR